MTMHIRRVSSFTSRCQNFSVLVISVLALLFLTLGGALHAAASSETSPALQKMSVPFVENQGQIDPLVSHYAQTMAGTLFVTRAGDLVLPLPQDKGGETRFLIERFQGATIGKPMGVDPSTARVSYFIGNDPTGWHSNLPTFDTLQLNALYPGITGELRAFGGSVEKLFELAAGADPGLLQIEIAGADRLAIDANGGLTAQVGDSRIRYSAPVAFQQIGERRVDVEVAYRLDGNRYGFTLGQYDERYPLVIDPVLQATYLGGSASEQAWDVAVHPAGDYVYVTGMTTSADFPGAVPPPSDPEQPDLSTFSGGSAEGTDAYIARLDASLTDATPMSVAYLGGSADETGRGITVTETGRVFVTGYTSSTAFPSETYKKFPGIRISPELPYERDSDADNDGQIDPEYTLCRTTLSCYDPDIEYLFFGNDAFLVELSPDLTSLERGFHLGGFRIWQRGDPIPSPSYVDEEGEDLAWDEATSSLYLVGTTNSPSLPYTDEAFQDTGLQGDDGFVVRFLEGSLGFDIVRTTFLGSMGNDSITAVDLGRLGGDFRLYVTGYTTGTLPSVSGGVQPTIGGQEDAFVAYFEGVEVWDEELGEFVTQ